MSVLPKIKGKDVPTKDFPKYTWNADLIEYDGPLLSLFKSEEGEDVLFSWLDSDKRKNRWAVVPLGRETLLHYLQKKTTLLEVFKKADYIFVVDYGSKARRLSRIRTHWESLPESYLPAEDSVLHESITTKAGRNLAEEKPAEYSLGLDGELYLEDISVIPRMYQQLYSFHYGLAHLARRAVRDKLEQISKSWRGGISGVNIFTGLASVTPGIHRARLCELKYNSPGHIKLSLLPALADEIAGAIKHIESIRSFREAEDLYSDVYRYLRAQKLSGFDEASSINARELTQSQSRRLTKFVNKFFDMMGWQHLAAEFEQLDADPLGQLRILLAYYRRLKRLREYVVSGKLAVP